MKQETRSISRKKQCKKRSVCHGNQTAITFSSPIMAETERLVGGKKKRPEDRTRTEKAKRRKKVNEEKTLGKKVH